MKTNKALIITAAALAVVVTGVAGVASAQPATGSTSLIDRIAERFHLNKSEVKQVFDDNKAAGQAQRQKASASRLDQAVKSGKLTAVQKSLILAKRQELNAFLASLSTMSPADR